MNKLQEYKNTHKKTLIGLSKQIGYSQTTTNNILKRSNAEDLKSLKVKTLIDIKKRTGVDLIPGVELIINNT